MWEQQNMGFQQGNGNVIHDTLIAVLRRQLTCGNSTTWDSNRGMAMCQAL